MNIDRSKLKLKRETRWHREYAMEQPNRFYHESKFKDGSAKISLAELEKEWPEWSDWERTDFCQEVGSANCSELPEILRFVMRNGEPRQWQAIANEVSYHLPADEAVPFLLRAYAASEPEHASNIIQALAKSGAPQAHAILCEHIERLWRHPDLIKEDQRINTVAAAAVHCLRHLLSLGEPAEKFRDKFEALMRHPTQANREMAQGFLGSHFTCGE